MNTTGMKKSGTQGAADASGPMRRYGCGPVRFSGADAALYERHLLFDNVVPAAAMGAA
jgi:starch phosphorylase